MNLEEVYYCVVNNNKTDLAWIEKHLIDYQKGISYYVEYREPQIVHWKKYTNRTPVIAKHIKRKKISKEQANEICKKWWNEWYNKK